KQVILEEIGMYEDRPFWIVLEQAMEDYFGEHPLGYRILGTNKTIQSLTRDQMLDYFAHRYSPDNIVVALAGKLDFDQCVQQIAGVCAAWERTGATRDIASPPPHAGDQRLVKPNTSMQYLVGMAPGPSAQDDDRYAAAVLSHVLGDTDGSRLYWKLIDPGYADEAELSHHAMDGTGQFLFFASCDPEKADQVEKILLETIDSIAKDLTDEEIERAVSKIAMDMTLQNERPAGRMMNLGGQWLYLNDYIPLEEELKRVQAVTADDLRKLVERYPFTPRTLIRMCPA
ncbi:MAG: pitrilysin family protein, partial [Phycisphaeraceae bacterium]